MLTLCVREKVFSPKPPIQGSFPLDHDGECKKEMLEYMLCIAKEKNENTKCRSQAKEYLGCRMKYNLMEKRDLHLFGYDKEESSESDEQQQKAKAK